MTGNKKFASRALITGCLLLCLLQSVIAQSGGDVDVAVVVHPDTPVSNLTLAEVRKVFLGDRQYWSTNVPVVLLIRAPVARERNVVLKSSTRCQSPSSNNIGLRRFFEQNRRRLPRWSTPMTWPMNWLPPFQGLLRLSMRGTFVRAQRLSGWMAVCRKSQAINFGEPFHCGKPTRRTRF